MIPLRILMSERQKLVGRDKNIRGRAYSPTSLYGVEDEKFINEIEKFGVVALGDSI